MEVWAEAMRSLNTADESTDLNLVLKVINENHTIPVVVTDTNGAVTVFRNLNVNGKEMAYADSLALATKLAGKLLRDGKVIRIELDDSLHKDHINVSCGGNTHTGGALHYPEPCKKQDGARYNGHKG